MRAQSQSHHKVPRSGELRARFGLPGHTTPLASSPRSLVWQVDLTGTPAVVKQVVDGPGASGRYERELAALLIAARADPPVAPALLATRVLAGWAIALTPHAGTVLTAVRMALVHDPARGPFGAIPARVRIDRGLEFAAGAVHDAFAALCIAPRRLPAFQPHRKGKVERVHRTIDQTLLCGLPGFTAGPRDAAGRLYGPLDDRFAARLRVAGDDGPDVTDPAVPDRLAQLVVFGPDHVIAGGGQVIVAVDLDPGAWPGGGGVLAALAFLGGYPLGPAALVLADPQVQSNPAHTEQIIDWAWMVETVSVKNPSVREIVEPCSSISGTVAAPAVNTAPASSAGPLTCSTGATPVKTSAPLRAWSRASIRILSDAALLPAARRGREAPLPAR